MKFFERKKFVFKLIVALCICLTFVNFCIMPSAHAEGVATWVGGKLLDPICDLLAGIGDRNNGDCTKIYNGNRC